ncbi:MAG: hypothetical protein AAF696_15335 [Bacteroidota bacterium]
MKRIGKLGSCICLLLLSLNYSCEESVAATCNYTQELQNETEAVSAAAAAYGQDQSTANCEAYRQAYLDFLDAAEKLDNCVPSSERDAYRQSIDAAQQSLNGLSC